VGECGTEGKDKTGHELPEGDAGGTTALGVGDRGRSERRTCVDSGGPLERR
jgi:hypothetical protein